MRFPPRDHVPELHCGFVKTARLGECAPENPEILGLSHLVSELLVERQRAFCLANRDGGLAARNPDLGAAG